MNDWNICQHIALNCSYKFLSYNISGSHWKSPENSSHVAKSSPFDNCDNWCLSRRENFFSRVWRCLTPLKARLTPITLCILTDNSKEPNERWRLRHDVNRQIYLWCFERFSQRDAKAHLMNFVTTSFELIKCLEVGGRLFLPFFSE